MANWNILGAGAIGHFFAAKLLKSKQHAALILRPKKEPQAYQFMFEDLHGQHTHHLLRAQSELTPKCDFLLVTLKAQQVVPALTLLKDQIDKSCCIVLMHNGMGTAEQVEKLLPNNPILIGTTANGVLRSNIDNLPHIKHTGLGVSWIGAFNKKAKRHTNIAQQLQAIEELYWSDAIREKLWLKLIINCAINPLTAINQCKNGELSQPALSPQVIKLVKELSLICQQVNLPWQCEALQQHVDDVIRLTAKNYSSMHQDIKFKRQSEIDYITGYILKVANAYHIDVPENERLYQQIKNIEAVY